MASDGSIDRRTKNPKAKRDFHLPIDILGVILRRLPRFGDHVRFRYVCRYWNSIEREHSPPPQLPWLFLPFHDKSGIPRFFSPSDNAVYCLRFPEGAPGVRFIGSCEGWLFLADQETKQIACINPFMKSGILLPRRTNLSNAVCELHEPPNVSTLVFNKAISSASPASSGCLIAAIQKLSYLICLCRPGSSNLWSINGHYFWGIADIIFYEGKLLALTLLGEVFVFEVEDQYSGVPVVTRTEKWAVARPVDLAIIGWPPGGMYLVESSGGDKIWAVLRRWVFNEKEKVLRSTEFRVYELDRSSGPFRWVEIESLGDQILFVCRKASKAFVASECEGCQADCIYFADENSDHRSLNPPDSGVYSMRDRSIRTFFPPRRCDSIQLGFP